MFRTVPAFTALIFISFATVIPAFAADTGPAEAPETRAAAAGTDPGATAAPGAKKPAPASTTAPKTAPKKPPITRTIDTQLSGFTSVDSDAVYGRLSIEEKRAGRTWYARGSVARTATHVNKTSHVLTYRLDSRHETMRNKDEYNVFSGVVSTRDRGTSSKKVRESGYQLASYGVGKQWDAKTKGEIGLGLVNIRDEDTGIQPAVVAGMQGSRPLSAKLTLNTDILAVQPMDHLRSTKLDSDIGLAYQMAPGFFLRLNWQATNLIRSDYSYSEWDSVVRLSISWRRTSTGK